MAPWTGAGRLCLNHDMANSTASATAPGEARLLRGAPFAVIELDAELRVTAWNDAAARMFAAPATEALGVEVGRLLATAEEFWPALAAGGGPRTVTHVRPDGARVVYEWTCHPERDADGRLLGAACYGQDITERVAREAAARRDGVLLRAILDNVDIIVWTMDHDGLCTFHEGKGLASAGMPQHALVGQNLRELYKNLDPEPLDRACKGELQRNTTEVHGASWVNWMVPIRGEGGSVEGLVGLSLDVTEQREGEKALREKLQQIEEQQQVIRRLSTPIIEVWDKVLTVPILGMIDTARAAELMDNLLQAVTRSRAQFAILDLTGVDEVDTGTAGHLLSLVRAVRLLGAESVITGIHPHIAQTIVSLGLETSTLTVHASLREALRHCIAHMSRSRK